MYAIDYEGERILGACDSKEAAHKILLGDLLENYKFDFMQSNNDPLDFLANCKVNKKEIEYKSPNGNTTWFICRFPVNGVNNERECV